MTDITELAQSLKAAAEKATPGRWEYYPGNTSIEYNVDSMDEDQGSIVYVDSGDFTQAQTDRNGEFIALANPANILALVEALEKAQETIAFQQGEIKALLSSLESRTVKLPDLRQIVSGDRYVWSDGVYNYSQDVKVVLAAAGIKVETE
ncbi:ead/Ea22-like family protein [Klebsiella pneumoniae]|uniref:ead/Ea22-like family protein n=1 Tax=Klebsiella pneumoniae TaxID=573 RepID=UPI00389031C3